jgi:hypothetical protein
VPPYSRFIQKSLVRVRSILSGYGFTDFICFQARAADFDALHTAIHDRTNFMQIGVKATLGCVQRM